MLPQLPMARELTVALPAAGSRRALVLDTNIVLDLLVFADPATALLPGLLASGALHWIATAGMRSELARVLSYPQIAPRVAFYGLAQEGVLARFDAAVQTVEPAPRAGSVCTDADDQPFIDLAAAHGAILLSKDKAVLRLRKRLLAYGAEVATSLSLIGPSQPVRVDAA